MSEKNVREIISEAMAGVMQELGADRCIVTHSYGDDGAKLVVHYHNQCGIASEHAKLLSWLVLLNPATRTAALEAACNGLVAAVRLTAAKAKADASAIAAQGR
jgi:hypothetical protein